MRAPLDFGAARRPRRRSRWPGAILLSALLGPLAVAQSPVISIEGANEALEANIRSHLRVSGEPCNASLVRLRRQLPDVEASALEAARALGWYRAGVEAAFEPGEACWRLQLRVTPGEPVLLSAPVFRVAGEDQATFQAVLAESGLRAGAQLNHGQYESFKNALSARAVENGYFSARFLRSEIRLDLVDNRAEIAVEFDPGQRYFFGEIEIDSGEVLSDEFVRRMVNIRPGEPYSSESLLRLREDLDKSLYFRQIGISPQLGEAENGRVPLQLNLTLRPRHAYSAGIGFSTDTGPRLRLNYENRYLNRRGHQWRADADLSPVRSQLDLNYRLPLRNPVRESVDFSSGLIREDTAAFNSQRFLLAGTYRNTSESGWSRNLFVNYQLDDYELAAEDDTRVLTMLGANLGRTQADDLIFPRRGWRLFSEVRGATDTLLSDVTFLQLYLSAKGVISVGETGRIISRLEGGSTWVDDVSDLPVSVRFFAGGDQSIRGYEYRSLGPTNADGQVEGGRHLLVGGVEYDFQVRGNWRLAAFYDSGNAFNDSGDFERFDTAGFGLRWLSPIGPLRADLAFPLEGEDSFRLHITMGPDL